MDCLWVVRSGAGELGCGLRVVGYTYQASVEWRGAGADGGREVRHLHAGGLGWGSEMMLWDDALIEWSQRMGARAME